MLMVAYDSVAYGSLLRIVAYEVPFSHVLSIAHEKKNEKLQRRFRRSYYKKNENI
jgi:hypothetical protein